MKTVTSAAALALLLGSITGVIAEDGRAVELDIEAQSSGGSLVGCLAPALQAAGMDWSTDLLQGYLGSAFAFSMKPGGGRVSQADTYHWDYYPEMLAFLEYENVSVSLKGSHPVTPAEHTQAKADAWVRVRRALDDGYPAIVWQPMTAETRASGQRPIPFLWALIVGYDEKAQTYTVDHSVRGRFTIRWDAFGHADRVNWFSVMIVEAQTRPFDARAAHRRAIERAIEISEGEYPGDYVPAHGLAAFDMWLSSFEVGSISVPDIRGHADFLIDARSHAALYLAEVEPHFPSTAHPLLRDAGGHYEEVADAMRALRDVSGRPSPDLREGADILARAIEHERAALANLQQVLAAE